MKRWVTIRLALAWVFAAVGVVVLLAAILISLSAQATATEQIQRERARSIKESCLAQNERHDDTIRQLNKLIAELPPERRERAREGSQGTVLLINALVPKRDCERIVEAAVDVSE